MAKVLVFGSTGQLACELAHATWPDGMAPTFLDRAAADLSRPETLGPIVERQRPDLVIIAAGFTRVDDAEDEEAEAMLLNASAPEAIAEAAAALAVPVVHFSSDYVFDGRKGAPYKETDTPCPLSAYGRSKLAGEQSVGRANPKHLILRTSWLFGPHGRNFMQTMLRLAETRDEIKVVDDEFSCPTDSGCLAQAVTDMLPRLLATDPPWGTYHLAGARGVSRFAYAEAILAELSVLGHRVPRLTPVSSRDFAAKADRPPDSRMSSAAAARAFGIALPAFSESLPAALKGGLPSAREAAKEAS